MQAIGDVHQESASRGFGCCFERLLPKRLCRRQARIGSDLCYAALRDLRPEGDRRFRIP
jgi:hypothetical protein